MDLNNFLTLILGGGLVGTITAAYNGIKTLRDGKHTREKSTIEDLLAQRKKAYEERDHEFQEKTRAFDERDEWRNRAADLEFLLRQNGIAVPPLRGGMSRGDMNERPGSN
jgi:hypothetical protein